jgi:hypothetical protein
MSNPLSTPNLYIFIHQNRANHVTMWTKCPQNPMVYNHFPPFTCRSIIVSPIMCFESLKSSLVTCSGSSSNFLLFFDLLWCRSQKSTKLIQNAYPTTSPNEASYYMVGSDSEGPRIRYGDQCIKRKSTFIPCTHPP